MSGDKGSLYQYKKRGGGPDEFHKNIAYTSFFYIGLSVRSLFLGDEVVGQHWMDLIVFLNLKGPKLGKICKGHLWSPSSLSRGNRELGS